MRKTIRQVHLHNSLNIINVKDRRIRRRDATIMRGRKHPITTSKITEMSPETPRETRGALAITIGRLPTPKNLDASTPGT
eukprot:9088655-Pyramimonas_sp.AAC.1